jgi:opacity protein-like surface antigen
MVVWGRIATAAVLAVALSTVAQTAPAGPESAGPLQPRYLLFSSTDVWRQGGFTHGGIVWAPSGPDRDGPVLKLMFGGGVYRYVSGSLGNIDVQGRELSAEILPGGRFVLGKLMVSAFLGADFQRHRLLPDDPSAGLRGGYAGARAGFELWYEPTAATMLAADASGSTIGPSYSARLAAGWRILDRFYFGPEVSGFSADGNYRQFRAGLHITGLRIKSFEWSMGLGWATDSDHHDGAYGKLGVFTRR